jgi:hypothetical protein
MIAPAPICTASGVAWSRSRLTWAMNIGNRFQRVSVRAMLGDDGVKAVYFCQQQVAEIDLRAENH